MYVGGNPPQTRKERLFHIKHESIDELIHFLFHKKKYVQILPIELLKKTFRNYHENNLHKISPNRIH